MMELVNERMKEWAVCDYSLNQNLVIQNYI
jgi:hypothetical protein